MFCRNCGQELSEGDRFCSTCGTKVQTKAKDFSGFEQPSFIKEEKTGFAAEEAKPKKRYIREEFNWDLDGLPTEKTKKTDEIDFNWASVLEERERRRVAWDPMFKGDLPEVVLDEDKKKTSPIEEKVHEPEETKVLSPEELEEELFGNSDSELNTSYGKENEEKIDKFYTFNKKNAEFQALLDEEYEKVKAESARTSKFKAAAEDREDLKDSLDRIINAKGNDRDSREIETDSSNAADVLSKSLPEDTLKKAEADVDTKDIEKVISDNCSDSETNSPEDEIEVVSGSPVPIAIDSENEQESEESVEKQSSSVEAAQEDESTVGILGAAQSGTSEALAIGGKEVEDKEVEDKATKESKEEISRDIDDNNISDTSEDKDSLAVGLPNEMNAEVESTEAEVKSEDEVHPPTAVSKVHPIKEEAEKSEEEQVKTRISYDDIFADDDEPVQKSSIGQKILKTIAVILCLVIIVQIGAIVIKFVDPTSPIAQKIDSIILSVYNLFAG